MRGQVVAVIAAGGAGGAAARYAVDVVLPTSTGGWPWATFVVNATGCLLIGALMVLVVDVWSVHRLVRPFLGVGVLGGYTTFSTYAVDAQSLIVDGRVGVAAAYLAGTAVAALVAVQAGVVLTRAATRRHGGNG
jgi:CrcB protein